MEIQFFFSISNTLYTCIPDYQGEKIRIPGLYRTNHEISDFVASFRECQDFKTYFTRISFGIPANFPVLLWNSRFFSQTEKNPLYRGWSVFIWNSPLLWLYSADFDKNNEWFQCIVLYAKFWLSHYLCAQWHIVMIINDNNILVCCYD